jgi:pyrroline-5-carboxylate reductase
MAELRRDPGLRIGIIGVGRVGHALATYLLRYADVFPDELFLVSSSKNGDDR